MDIFPPAHYIPIGETDYWNPKLSRRINFRHTTVLESLMHAKAAVNGFTDLSIPQQRKALKAARHDFDLFNLDKRTAKIRKERKKFTRLPFRQQKIQLNLHELTYFRDEHKKYLKLMKGRKLILVSTGGTALCKKDPAGFLSPDLSGTGIFGALNTYMVDSYDVAETTPFKEYAKEYPGISDKGLLDSADIVPDLQEALAKHLEEIIDDKNMPLGVVVIHGTDTMANTAAALSFYYKKLPVPIILTGAMVEGEDPASDILENLKGACLFAATAPLKPGVYIYFNHRLFKGTRVFHDSVKRHNAFNSAINLEEGASGAIVFGNTYLSTGPGEPLETDLFPIIDGYGHYPREKPMHKPPDERRSGMRSVFMDQEKVDVDEKDGIIIPILAKKAVPHIDEIVWGAGTPKHVVRDRLKRMIERRIGYIDHTDERILTEIVINECASVDEVISKTGFEKTIVEDRLNRMEYRNMKYLDDKDQLILNVMVGRSNLGVKDITKKTSLSPKAVNKILTGMGATEKDKQLSYLDQDEKQVFALIANKGKSTI